MPTTATQTAFGLPDRLPTAVAKTEAGLVKVNINSHVADVAEYGTGLRIGNVVLTAKHVPTSDDTHEIDCARGSSVGYATVQPLPGHDTTGSEVGIHSVIPAPGNADAVLLTLKPSYEPGMQPWSEPQLRDPKSPLLLGETVFAFGYGEEVNSDAESRDPDGFNLTGSDIKKGYENPRIIGGEILPDPQHSGYFYILTGASNGDYTNGVHDSQDTVHQGDSGGPVVDRNGKVIGIVLGGYDDSNAQSLSEIRSITGIPTFELAKGFSAPKLVEVLSITPLGTLQSQKAVACD